MEVEHDCEKFYLAVAIAGIASPVANSTFQLIDGIQIEVKMASIACWEGRITTSDERPETHWTWQIPVLGAVGFSHGLSIQRKCFGPSPRFQYIANHLHAPVEMRTIISGG